MTTIIVNVPDKDRNLFSALIKKLGFASRVVTAAAADPGRQRNAIRPGSGS